MADMTYLDDALKPQKLKTGPALRRAAFSKSLSQYVTQMGWMSPHYLRFRNMLARAEKQSRSEGELRRLRANLDRARALPGTGARHVVVDAASGQLWYYEAGKQVGTMRVVTGMAQTPTPMFAGMINYAILNPYWNVPVDLAQSKIAPRVLGGRTLKSMGMEALADWGENPRKVSQSSINWKAVAAGDQEVRLRQLPGATNAMGKVKFLFPNEEGIYLHDTPERALFKKSDRHFSNGCIRLEDAARLGNWLLGKPVKSATKAPEQAVPLPVPVPIYITYFTATTGKSGTLAFLKDVYRRDP
jgi:L,D-transpeptidase YcbB